MWCLVVLGLVGCFCYWQQSETVFPSASIDLPSRQNRKSKPLPIPLKQNITTTRKTASNQLLSILMTMPKHFEYELGTSKANALMRSEIPVWYWSTRYCKPLKEEEFACWLNLNGKLVSFEHVVENDQTLPDVSHALALLMKQVFSGDIGIDLSHYKLVENSSIKQVHRTDHYFTFEDTSQSFAGAKLRAYAYVSAIWCYCRQSLSAHPRVLEAQV